MLSGVQVLKICSRSVSNEVGLQMLSEQLRQQIFRAPDKKAAPEQVKKVTAHLEKHGLHTRPQAAAPDIVFDLPPLKGGDIEEHFAAVAKRQGAPYQALAQAIHDLFSKSTLPPPPTSWRYAAGWTRYDHETRSVQPVDFVLEDAAVFDVEVLVTEGNYPTVATAMTPKAWYSWCSPRLTSSTFRLSRSPSMEFLIPMESAEDVQLGRKNNWQERLIVGHNVSFDRTFIKEQYLIKGPKTRFLDTMSMHIAISGFTSTQRIMYNAAAQNKKTKEVPDVFYNIFEHDDSWMKAGALNNLKDVYRMHCISNGGVETGEELDKEKRSVFVEGSMMDVRSQFQELMAYCAGDVTATGKVFAQLWKPFFERFPHPVTFAGMLEMGSAYLPVNENWRKYLEESDATCNDLEREMKHLLMQLADAACGLLHDKRYEDDPWLYGLDWSVKELKLLTLQLKKLNAKRAKDAARLKKEAQANVENEQTSVEIRDVVMNRLKETLSLLPKREVHLPGYPNWYRELCPRMSDPDWCPGPSLLSTQTRVTPLLLRLTWDGFPLYHSPQLGWGYLVPGRTSNIREWDALAGTADGATGPARFPHRKAYELLKDRIPADTAADVESTLKHVFEDDMNTDSSATFFKQLKSHKDALAKGKSKGQLSGSGSGSGPSWHKGDGPYDAVDIPGCWFYRIPHKDGSGKNVGNPLAKDYLSKFEDGTLSTEAGLAAKRVLLLNKMVSYWRNARDRITSQMVVWLRDSDMPSNMKWAKENDEFSQCGAILPRIVSAGTVTRRAVEPTWLTASNAKVDRVGSELKAMVQAPVGYDFVGADVDAQELWIAGLIGDAHFAGIQGGTAFGWMTLQGKKQDGTDLHSKTAAVVGISREQAKVFNYGRIYGAGKNFAQKLLMQFNHRLTEEEAMQKARLMYAATKGVRKRASRARNNQRSTIRDRDDLNYDDDDLCMELSRWEGGTESELFNKLEEIANSKMPMTPVLSCRISQPLEPKNAKHSFMTSRVNWVVQSSAVDYLHLLLVCMRWLFEEFDIDGRFCISIHDEVRYLVRSEDRYRAALSLQIANLLTRSMFVHRMGMTNLPQSVAFFSSIEIDKCLRKESTLTCVTPSNPYGLERGYGIKSGEALDINEILAKTAGTLCKAVDDPRYQKSKQATA